MSMVTWPIERCFWVFSPGTLGLALNVSPFPPSCTWTTIAALVEPIKCNLAANCMRVVCRLFRLVYAISAKLTKFIGAPVQAGGVTYETACSTPRAQAKLGEVCCDVDSHVDRTFLIEVFFISAAQKLLRAVQHEQVPPKFSSNTRLAKGLLCPKKSIRSIKSSTAR
jgi:hypothetical protein